MESPRYSGVYVWNNSDRTRILGTSVKNGLDNGIRFLSSKSVVVDGCTSSGNVQDGFRANGDSCIVSNNISLSNLNGGIRADGSSGSVWSGNLVGYNLNQGIAISSSAPALATGVLITGNRSLQNNSAGIQLYANGVNFDNIKVEGNILDGNVFGSIRLLAGNGGIMDRCTVTDNHIYNGENGIQVIPDAVGTGTITNLVLSNNQIFNSSSDAIEISAATNACTAFIGENTFQGNAVDENLSFTNWTYSGASTPVASTLAGLAASKNGTSVYCTDCLRGSTPCTAASTGAIAFRVNGTWDCMP